MQISVFFFCLAVSHGRPFMPTVLPLDGIVPSTVAPLTAVTTTSEDLPTSSFPESTPAVATPTVTRTTAETPLPELFGRFDLDTCADADTACYFLPRCYFPSSESQEMLFLPISKFLLESTTSEFRGALIDCPAIAVVKGGNIEVHVFGPTPSKAITLAAFGLTVEADDRVRCDGCTEHEEMSIGRRVTHSFKLPKATTATVIPATTVSTRNTVTTTTTVALPTTVTRHHRTTTMTPHSLDTGDFLDDVTTAEVERFSSKTKSTEIVIICLIVLLIIVVLGLIVAVIMTNRKLHVHPTSPVANVPTAWSSKRTSASSKSQSSITVVPEWPIIPGSEGASTEDFDERTPLAAAVSPRRTPTTAKSVHSYTKSLVQRAGAAVANEGPEFTARPPTPSRSRETISVTPSKDPQLKQMLKSPERKQPQVAAETAELPKQTDRSLPKLNPTQSNSYQEVSM